jgi:hypothetical protein
MIARRSTNPTYNGSNGLGLFAPADVGGIFSRSDSAGWVDAVPAPGPVAALPPVPLPDMLQQAADAETIFKDYGGRSLATPDSHTYNLSAPWIDKPDGFESFLPLVAIPTPATDGLDHVIFQFTVPAGWDGLIKRIANYYSGPGIFSNLGALTWRVLRNAQPVRNFDNLQLFYGNWSANGGVIPMEFDGIQIRSGDVVAMVVNHAVNSALPVGGTSVVGFLGGYLYPKES